MASSKDKKKGSDSLADYRALRGNLEKTLRSRRAAQNTAQSAHNGKNTDAARNSVTAAPRIAPKKSDIILASYNIHKCVGTDKIFNPQRIIDVITGLNADILALQEVDKRFGERSGLLDLADLEKRTGLRPVPIRAITPQGQGWHGNALFFREGAIRSIEQITLPGVESRGALIADFCFKAGPLRIIAAHFGLLRRSRALQAEAILNFLKNKQDMPSVLLGDLNEWRIGKNSSLNGLRPFFTDKTELAPSFPSRFPLLALDRVFSTPHNLVRSLTVYDTALARLASDHLPIKAVIRLPGLPKKKGKAEAAIQAQAQILP